ncbi:MAG: flavin reductase family protein [Myxococcota bacterium]|nr:flavin reductase family protein [Myxococcota bacterium]
MATDTHTFKETLASWASGVTVVTTVYGEERHGLTASAFSSLSMDPPLVLVCVNKGSRSDEAIKQGEAFGVSILGTDQVFWGERFAGFHGDVEDRFDGCETFTRETGSPILTGSLGWLDCRLWAVYDGGDHHIFVGEVVEAGSDAGKKPVMYYDRAWRGVGAPVDPKA